MKTEMLSMNPSEFCRASRSCTVGSRFALQQDSMADAWDLCPHVEWLLWILTAIEAPIDPKAARLCIVESVRQTSAVFGLLNHRRSLEALHVAERHAKGDASDQDLKRSWDSASTCWSGMSREARVAAQTAAWSAVPVINWTALWHGTRLADNVLIFRKHFANPFRVS